MITYHEKYLNDVNDVVKSETFIVNDDQETRILQWSEMKFMK